jgi:hypothetical protein
VFFTVTAIKNTNFASNPPPNAIRNCNKSLVLLIFNMGMQVFGGMRVRHPQRVRKKKEENYSSNSSQLDGKSGEAGAHIRPSHTHTSLAERAFWLASGGGTRERL